MFVTWTTLSLMVFVILRLVLPRDMSITPLSSVMTVVHVTMKLECAHVIGCTLERLVKRVVIGRWRSMGNVSLTRASLPRPMDPSQSVETTESVFLQALIWIRFISASVRLTTRLSIRVSVFMTIALHPVTALGLNATTMGSVIMRRVSVSAMLVTKEVFVRTSSVQRGKPMSMARAVHPIAASICISIMNDESAVVLVTALLRRVFAVELRSLTMGHVSRATVLPLPIRTCSVMVLDSAVMVGASIDDQYTLLLAHLHSCAIHQSPSWLDPSFS